MGSAEAGFALHSDFVDGSIEVAELGLCHGRLQRDARFPWVILIPRRARARELEDLGETDRALLLDEILAVGRAVRAIAETAGQPVTKLNIGVLGNITPQLHVHVIGRRSGDAAWPGPVWGVPGAIDYDSNGLRLALAAVRSALETGG